MAATKIRVLGTFNTTSAETINATTFVVATGKVSSCIVSVVGYDATNGGGMSFMRLVSVKNITGTVSLVGGAGTNIVAPQKDSGYAAAGISESVSGNTLTITVSGQTGKPIFWSVIMEIDTF